MASIGDFNKGSVFEVNFEKLGWVSLEDLYNADGDGAVYTLTGLFINQKGKYGPRPYVSTDLYLVDLPQHRLEDIEQMLTMPEIVQQVTDGKAGFTIRPYISRKYDKECFDVFFRNL